MTKAKDARYRQRLKSRVISYYSLGTNKCSCCGEWRMEFLSLDHTRTELRGNANYGYRKTDRNHLYQWIVRNGYPSGFDVLCMNCNFAKGHHGECPHKKETQRHV